MRGHEIKHRHADFIECECGRLCVHYFDHQTHVQYKRTHPQPLLPAEHLAQPGEPSWQDHVIADASRDLAQTQHKEMK